MLDKKEYDKKYYLENRERILRIKKQYQENNYETIRKKKKEYYLKNIEKILDKRKQWCKENPEKVKEDNKNYIKNNKEKVRERKRIYCKNKRKTDLRYNLSKKISRAVSYSLREGKNGRCWEDLVGYTANDLIRHLKGTMSNGYTWQDYIEGKLHVDHKIPISAHNFTKPEHADFKSCWALSNLRLLPAKENMVKNNKLSNPFQPALKLSIVGVI